MYLKRQFCVGSKQSSKYICNIKFSVMRTSIFFLLNVLLVLILSLKQWTMVNNIQKSKTQGTDFSQSRECTFSPWLSELCKIIACKSLDQPIFHWLPSSCPLVNYFCTNLLFSVQFGAPDRYRMWFQSLSVAGYRKPEWLAQLWHASF